MLGQVLYISHDLFFLSMKWLTSFLTHTHPWFRRTYSLSKRKRRLLLIPKYAQLQQQKTTKLFSAGIPRHIVKRWGRLQWCYLVVWKKKKKHSRQWFHCQSVFHNGPTAVKLWSPVAKWAMLCLSPTTLRQWQDLPPVAADNEGKLMWTWSTLGLIFVGWCHCAVLSLA